MNSIPRCVAKALLAVALLAPCIGHAWPASRRASDEQVMVLDAGLPLVMSVDVPQGKFVPLYFGPVVTAYDLTAEIDLQAFHDDGRWLPLVAIGFEDGDGEGEDVSHSGVRVRVIRGKDTTEIMVAVQITADGKVIDDQLVSDGLTGPVRLHVMFGQGLLGLAVNDEDPVVLHTPFTRVTPSMFTSSCKAAVTLTRLLPGEAI
jgi:hypothetical protein